MEGEPAWWTIFAFSAGATVVFGAVILSVMAAVALGVSWVRGRRSR
ncbi:hypothetical protein [Streptomyces sp. NPDC005435]